MKRSRAALILGLWILALSGTVAGQTAATLEWGMPVQFTDFECPAPPGDSSAAKIAVTILLGYAKGRDGALKFRVSAVMDKAESWVRPGFENQEVLHHEQGHFDIAHIYARKLDFALRGRQLTLSDIDSLHVLYDQFLAQMDTVQVRYDRETAGGLDRNEQRRWAERIAGEINGLK